jgi:Cysteine-rich CPCC
VKIGVPKMDEMVAQSPAGTDYFVNVFGLPEEGIFYHCPCCDYPTLASRGGFEVCPICYWEDDGQGSHDADRERGGPNNSLCLTEARRNFVAFGACEAAMKANVRPPSDDEKKYRKYYD